MQEGIVVELDERLERDPETAAIIQYRVMMIGNAPRPRVQVQARIELAGLGGSAKLCVDVAPSYRPVPAAGTEVVFEDADAVARALEFDRRRHSGKAGAQDDDRSALGIALELDRPAIWRFRREPKPGHDLIRARSAEARADELDQSSPAHQGRSLTHRSVLFPNEAGTVWRRRAMRQRGAAESHDDPSRARTAATGAACARTRSAAAGMSSIDARGRCADGSAKSPIKATIQSSSG